MRKVFAQRLVASSLIVGLCIAIIALMSLTCVQAATDESDDHGRNAQSESMSIGPDGSTEGALEAPEGYEDPENINELEVDGTLSSDEDGDAASDEQAESEEKEETKDKKEKKGGLSMDATLIAAMIAAGVTIVIGEYVTNNRKKK